MKRLIALSLALVATACGTANDAAQTSALPSSQPEIRTERSLFPINGTISNVSVHSAEAPAQGLWTEVEVEYMVNCSHKFESAALSYERGTDGKIKILSSAFASAANNTEGMMVCQAFSHEAAKVTLPGIVSLADLEIVNLRAQAQDIPDDTASISSLGNMEVVATRSLCPEGMACVQGGTIVTVATTLNSCVNSLGPVAYKVEQRLEKGEPLAINLTVNAIEFHSERAANVRCFAPQVVQHEITLPMVFGSQESINLRIIQ